VKRSSGVALLVEKSTWDGKTKSYPRLTNFSSIASMLAKGDTGALMVEGGDGERAGMWITAGAEAGGVEVV